MVIFQKFGPACGKHASCTFYKALKLTKNGKSRVIALGQFFFMKILKGIPVCIGELQLVWEDKTSSQDLTSVRLYFLPECTPEGRQPHHGEDEVLAYSEKIVLKLDDLASLVVEDVSWSEGRRAFATEKLVAHKEHADLEESFHMNSFGLDNSNIQKQADQTEDEVIKDTSPSICIMSYSRYCRYRGIMRRLENCADKWMRHAVVSALGGFHTANENNRIYFCRDLFDHADLDDFELRCDHLAPNLKGRPRKRRGSKQGNGNDSSEDSSCSSSFSSQQDGTSGKIRTGARTTPLRNGFRIDKIKVSKDEQEFLGDLHRFMKARNTPIGRIPSLGFKQIDLFQFYTLAEDIGGYEQISNKRMWKHLYDKLGGNPGFTSAATCTRRHYEKLLLPFERYVKNRDIAAQQRRKRVPSEETMERKVEEESRTVLKDEELKENIKKEIDIKEEPKLNGHSHLAHVKQEVTLGNHSSLNSEMKARALIIKQEIEKMKMRKDAQKHVEKEPFMDKEKMWEERRKIKLGDKVRKPSGCQKTVRELLDQNGREISDISNDKVTENLHESNADNAEEKKHIPDVKKERDRSDLKFADSKVPLSLPASLDPRAHQALLSPLGPGHPMFYPQLVPMSGGLRGVPPMPMPFMLPHVGISSVANSLQSMHSTGNPIYKDSKPLHALNQLVKEQKDSSKIHAMPNHKSAIDHSHSKPRVSPTPPLSNPPTAHSQQPQSITSPSLHNPTRRNITPAHSNHTKRSYPYTDHSKSPSPYGSSFPFDHKSVSDPPNKRPKMLGSKDSSVFGSSTSGQLDIPVLDLSMKTLKAQEARQQRGESLLFNTSFSRENRGHPKSRPEETPQDLSLRPSSRPSSKSSAHDLPAQSSHRSTPLNIPQLRSPPDLKSSNFSIPVLSESHHKDTKQKSEKSEPLLSPSKLASLGAMPTIGGLPIDIGALVHPAFPQQMLMHGVFPTPLQLQQMIQGQVAAGMSMLHPEFLPQSLMFPPTLTSVPASFSSPTTSVKSSSSTAGSSKR